MGFLKKLFGGSKNGDDQELESQDQSLEQEGPEAGNQESLEAAGLDEGEEKKGSWLSRAFQGLKNAGQSMGDGAKDGAKVGGLLGALPGGLVGAGVGGAVGGSVGGKTGAKVGAMGLGGLLALPGALIGGALGGLTGAAKGLFDEATYDEEELLQMTADIPGYHVILEQLAHTYAYGKGDMGTLDAWGYELVSEHEDKNSGFRVVAFKPKVASALDPDGKPLKPVVAFRGTANAGGAMDDLNEGGVGTFQFSRNEKEISQVLQSAKGSSAPDVTGHSLGGALAQLAAARFGSMVGDIVTFQAAGIEGAEAQRIDADEHEATHYRAAGDLVHSGGEGFAVGKVVEFEHKGIDTALSHMTFPLAELNALRGKGDSDAPHVEGARSSDDEWVIDKKGDYHNGHWADEKVQTRSRLHEVDKHDDANTTEGQAGVIDLIGGRKNATKIHKAASGMGLTDRQGGYAKAWRAIRGVAMNIQGPEDVPRVRDRIIDLCIEHEVEPRDHAKFISQGEAAMLDALDLKVAQAAVE